MVQSFTTVPFVLKIKWLREPRPNVPNIIIAKQKKNKKSTKIDGHHQTIYIPKKNNKAHFTRKVNKSSKTKYLTFHVYFSSSLLKTYKSKTKIHLLLNLNIDIANSN